MTASFRLFVLVVLLYISHSVAVDTTETCNADGTGSCNAETKENSNDSNDCVDTHKDCSFWASKGECDANPNYMLRNCQKACNVCNSNKSVDELIRDKQKEKEEETE